MSAHDIIFDPNIFAVATGIEAHNDYGRAFIDAATGDPPNLRWSERVGRAEQPVVQFPWQQRATGGDARRLPVPRHQGGPEHGDRQRWSAARLRGHPRRSDRTDRGRDPQPPSRRHRTADRRGVRRQVLRRRQSRGPDLADTLGPRSTGPRPRPRVGRVRRRRRRGGSPHLAERIERDRGSTDGRHEYRGRSVRFRPNVPPPGGQERPRDEESGRPSRAVHVRRG